MSTNQNGFQEYYKRQASACNAVGASHPNPMVRREQMMQTGLYIESPEPSVKPTEPFATTNKLLGPAQYHSSKSAYPRPASRPHYSGSAGYSQGGSLSTLFLWIIISLTTLTYTSYFVAGLESIFAGTKADTSMIAGFVMVSAIGSLGMLPLLIGFLFFLSLYQIVKASKAAL